MLEKMWSKGNTYPSLVRIKIIQPLWIMMASQKIGHQPTSGSSNITLGIYPKDAQSYFKGICSTILIAALLVIVRTWKQTRCPSTEEQIKKMWQIYTLEYYSAVKTMTS